MQEGIIAADAGELVIVAEGSNVTLRGKRVSKLDHAITYSWEQTNGIDVELKGRDTATPSFKAPYIDTSNMLLTFKLTIKEGNNIAEDTINVIVKKIQRALILQGGGALGAYEAGVLEALYEKLIEEDRENGIDDRPLFDIVAGASIGAVNAALLTNQVLQYKTNNKEAWKHAIRSLKNFWKELSEPLPLFDNQFFTNTWDYWKEIRNKWQEYFNSIIDTNTISWREKFPFVLGYFLWPDKWGQLASGEGARRYYSYKYFLNNGSKNVVYPAIPQFDLEFLDPQNVGFRFNNDPLVDTLKRYWDYDKPIKTKEGEPRLLIVSVDIQDCTTAVTFDSYSNATEYGKEPFRYKIQYDGIHIEHVKASMSAPIGYKYQTFEVEKDGIKEERSFWDGAFISNTPLQELISKHKDYWKRKNNGIPDLEIYVINLYPSLEKHVPESWDAINDRETEVKFHDRTKYAAKTVNETADYIDLINLLATLSKRLIKHAGKSQKELIKELLVSSDNSIYDALLNDILKKIRDDGSIINGIENIKGDSKDKKGNRISYKKLLDNKTRIKVTYIERVDDNNTIFGKAFDTTYKTISNLYNNGYNDALKIMWIEILRDKLKKLGEYTDIDAIESKLYEIEAYINAREIDDARSAISEVIEKLENKLIIDEKIPLQRYLIGVAKRLLKNIDTRRQIFEEV